MEYEAYFGNDDATPERIRKARQAGLGASLADIYLPSGLPSGAKRRQIETPLETALRRGWINAEQKEAGDRFRLHMIGARAQLRFSTSKWQMPIDCGGYINPEEKKFDHEVALRQALLCLQYRVRQPFLDWISLGEQDDTNIREFGAMFSRLNHKEAQKSVGIYVLGVILDDLAEHFGYIVRKNSWETRRQLEELLSRNRSQWR